MNLNQVRTKIAALQAERASLTEHRRSRAHVAEMIDARIARWQQDAAESIRVDVDNMLAGRPSTLGFIKADGRLVDLGPLLMLSADVDRIRAAFTAALTAAAPGDDVPDAAERIAAINQELDRLELLEERLVMQKGAQRRPDARPEIILAPFVHHGE